MANTVQPLWEPDKDGSGYVRAAKPAPDPPDPFKDPLYGWKPDPEGGGYIRIPEEELPPIPRQGTWCKIFGLEKNTEMNGRIVEVVETNDVEGTVNIAIEGSDHFMIKAINLAPLPGSEKLCSLHREVSLQLNGINCAACKKALKEALCAVEGVDEVAISITTKQESDKHPNPVTVKGAIDEATIKAAIVQLDRGRSKYTIA